MKIKIFLDSDVVISSLLSYTGAAYFLTQSPIVNCHISNYSIPELKLVCKRLNIPLKKLDGLLNEFETTEIKEDLGVLIKLYREYCSDPNDVHVIAGASVGKHRFLITYSLKHYHIDKIKDDLGIIVLTPAQMLQYLRSL